MRYAIRVSALRRELNSLEGAASQAGEVARSSQREPKDSWHEQHESKTNCPRCAVSAYAAGKPRELQGTAAADRAHAALRMPYWKVSSSSGRTEHPSRSVRASRGGHSKRALARPFSAEREAVVVGQQMNKAMAVKPRVAHRCLTPRSSRAPTALALAGEAEHVYHRPRRPSPSQLVPA